MSLQPGRYVASCDVTERGSAKARIQYWGEIHHVQLGEVYGAVIGVNVMRFDLQPDADTCHFAVCGCRATDFLVERADTYATAAGGGGFRASSPRRPRRTSPVKAGGRR